MTNLFLILLSFLPGLVEPSIRAYWVPRDSTATILVDVKLPPSDLIFKKKNDTYSASIDIELTVKSGRERLYNGIRHFRFNLKDYLATHADSLILSRTIKLSVPIKKSYTLRVKGRDVENRDVLFNRKLKLGDFVLPVSDLIPIDIKKYRQGVKEIVSVEDVSGGTLGVWVRSGRMFSAVFELKPSKTDSVVWRDAFEIEGDTVLEICIDSLTTGKYDLVGTFNGDTVSDRRVLSFNVFNIMRLSSKDFNDLIGILTYIAEPWEIDSLENAPDSLRQKEWDEFWKRRDPTPGTPENEFMEEYLERVKYANAHFSYGSIPGYKTDRGMIYIKYGPPDDIEQHPFELDSPPYEVWRYYSQNLVFIFVDKSGVGDYELVYPYGGYPLNE